MLTDVNEGNRQIVTIPRKAQAQFRLWKSRLTTAEITAIKADIDSMLASGLETTSWMPGADWTGTSFAAIYYKSTRQDPVAAAMCFGLFVMECVLDRVRVHGENWCTGRFEKDGDPIRGRTYFRV